MKADTPVSREGVKHRMVSWSNAFRGFYDKGSSKTSNDFVTRMLYSMRSTILVISFQAAVISGLLAYIFKSFSLLNFLLILLSFVLLHTESNLLNDYFGFRYGHDSPDSPRRRYTLHPIADGIVSMGEMVVTLFVISAVLLSIAAYFLLLRGTGAFILILAGVIFLALYDVSSVSLKMMGLGEISSFVVWGPLMIAGGFYAITGTINLSVVLASVPFGLGVMSVLIGKHIDQMPFDSKKGIGTLPVRLGEYWSRAMLLFSMVAMYATVAISAIFLLLPFTLLLVFINISSLLKSFSVIRKSRPPEPPPGYVGWPLWYHRQALLHEKLFGWLYIAGLLLYPLLSNLGIPVHFF